MPLYEHVYLARQDLSARPGETEHEARQRAPEFRGGAAGQPPQDRRCAQQKSMFETVANVRALAHLRGGLRSKV